MAFAKRILSHPGNERELYGTITSLEIKAVWEILYWTLELKKRVEVNKKFKSKLERYFFMGHRIGVSEAILFCDEPGPGLCCRVKLFLNHATLHNRTELKRGKALPCTCPLFKSSLREQS